MVFFKVQQGYVIRWSMGWYGINHSGGIFRVHKGGRENYEFLFSEGVLHVLADHPSCINFSHNFNLFLVYKVVKGFFTDYPLLILVFHFNVLFFRIQPDIGGSKEGFRTESSGHQIGIAEVEFHQG